MPGRLARQLARPSGLIGRQIAREMAARNAAMIDGAIDLLEVRPGDRVAEIGFGSSRSLEILTKRAAPGLVVGLDHSPLAVRNTSRRLRAQISAGNLRVVEAGAHSLPLDDGSIDRLLAVNTVTYWADLEAGFRELRRVSSETAALVIGVRAPQDLRRLGIEGESVNHLDQSGLVDLAGGHGFGLERAARGSDGLGEYILVRLLRRD